MSAMSTWSATDHPPVTWRAPRRRSLSTDFPTRTSARDGHPGAPDHGQREYLLAASGELARALLAGQGRHDVKKLIAARARQATSASLALVGTSTDGELLSVVAAAGPDSERLHGRTIRLRPMALTGLGWSSNVTQVAADPAPRSSVTLSLGTNPEGEQRVLLVLGLPVAGRAAASGALRRFAADTTTALALANGRLAAEQERLLEDRDRSARGLSELVIPLLFDAGLRLAGAEGLLPDRSLQARIRLRLAADDLDRAIAQVRAVALGVDSPGRPSLPAGPAPDHAAADDGGPGGR